MLSSRYVAALLGVLCACGVTAASCSAKKPRSAVVVGVRSELVPNSDFDEVRIDVSGAASSSLDLSFASAGDHTGDLPTSLRVDLPDGADATAQIQVVVSALSAGKARVVRTATLTFAEGRTKLLPMAIGFSCVGVDCAAGNTCVAGQCVRSAVDAASLPDFDLDKVYGVFGDGTCFDDGYASCFSGAVGVDVKAIAATADCSVSTTALPRVALPACAAAGMGGAAGAAGGVDGGMGSVDGGVASPPSGSPPGAFNVALHYSLDSDDTRFVTLDEDPVEGFSFTDASRSRFRLSPGLCHAAQQGAITRMMVAWSCGPKQVTQPRCASPPEDAGVSSVLGVSDTVTAQAGCHLYARGVCDLYTRCAPIYVASRGAGNDCVSQATTSCVHQLALTGAPDTKVWAELGLTLRLTSCESFADDSYQEVPSGTLLDGAACSSASQCLGGICHVSSGSCGVCTSGTKNALLPDGGVCALGTKAINGVCTDAYPRTGKPCLPIDGGGTCEANALVCKNGTCVIPTASPHVTCESYYDCDSLRYSLDCLVPDGGTKGTCERNITPTLGEGCQGQCDYRSYCDKTACGVCQARHRLGEPCGVFDGGVRAECQIELSCSDAGTCIPYLPPACDAPKDAGPG